MDFSPPEEKSSGFDTLVAILIAVVTVFGALVTWRAAEAADRASDADFEGMKAVVSYDRTVSLSTMRAYENQRNFFDYQYLQDLAKNLRQDLEQVTDDAEYDRLNRLKEEAYFLAEYARVFFPNKYAIQLEDNTYVYDVQRDLGEQIADAARTENLEFAPLFADADAKRSKSNLLVVSVTILSIALVILTTLSSLGKRTQRVLLGVAILIALLGVGSAVYFEFFL